MWLSVDGISVDLPCLDNIHCEFEIDAQVYENTKISVRLRTTLEQIWISYCLISKAGKQTLVGLLCHSVGFKPHRRMYV